MLILGHRGASQAQPENTLEAFAAAYAGNADGLEFDVRGDSQVIPVISHDRTLERRAGDPRNIDAMTVAEIKQLDAGNGFKIPTLAETLDLCAGRGFLDIEVKQAGIEREILDILSGYAGAWAISSFDWSALAAFRALDEQVELWLLAVQFSDALFDIAHQIAARGVAMHHSQLNESSIATARERGLSVLAWTVNDAEEAQRIADLGVDILVTDVPEKLFSFGKTGR